MNDNTYWQYLQTDGLPFPRSNNRSMSRALLLLTTGLTMGATRVVTSSNVLEHQHRRRGVFIFGRCSVDVVNVYILLFGRSTVDGSTLDRSTFSRSASGSRSTLVGRSGLRTGCHLGMCF